MTGPADDVLDLFARVHLTALRDQPLDMVAVPAGRLDRLASWSAPGWRCHGGHVGTAVDLVVVDAGTDPTALGRIRPGGLAVVVGDHDGTDRWGLVIVDRVAKPIPLTVLRSPTDTDQVPSPLASIRRGRLGVVAAARPAPASGAPTRVRQRVAALVGERGRRLYRQLRR